MLRRLRIVLYLTVRSIHPFSYFGTRRYKFKLMTVVHSAGTIGTHALYDVKNVPNLL